jgi:hypothetical protein
MNSELDWGDLERRPDGIRTTPEGHLWIAVILRAVNDSRQAEPDNDALTWLFSDRAKPLDFVWLCDVLDMSVEQIRNSVRNHIQPTTGRVAMTQLLRSMFARIPAPFTCYQAQQHLQKMWFPKLVQHAIAKALRIGVLAHDPEGRDYYRVTVQTKEPKCHSTHAKTGFATSAASPEGCHTTTPVAQKLGKHSTQKTSVPTPPLPPTSTTGQGSSTSS